MPKRPSNSRMAATTRLVRSPPMVSGSPSIRCGITIRLIYLSCAPTERTCGRSPMTLNQTGSHIGSRSIKVTVTLAAVTDHRRGLMKKLNVILILIFLLSGCSGLPISIPFLGTAVPTQTPLPQFTATPFSLDPTFTPDLFVLNTLEATATPPSGTPQATDTPFSTPDFSPDHYA